MEILVCCDSWIQYERYIKILSTGTLNKLYLLVLFKCEFNDLERLANTSSCCELLIVDIFGKLKLKRELLELIERLSAKFSFKAFVFIERASACCYHYNNGECVISNQLVSSVSPSVLTEHNIELLTADKAQASVRCGIGLLYPLRYYSNTLLVCAYNTCVDIWRNIVLGVCNKLTFYRVRALLFCVRSVSAQNDLNEYKLVLRKLIPRVVISLTSFVCARAVNAHKSVVFQLGVSCERLFKLVHLGCGLTKLELCKQLELPEIEGKVFTRAVSFAIIRFSLTHSGYVRTFKVILNRLNLVIKMLLCWLTLITAAHAFVFVIFNYPSSDARIGNGVGLDTIASIANANWLLTQRAHTTRAELITNLRLGITNYSNLNRIIRATMSLATRAWAIDDINTTRLWGKASVDPFVTNGFSGLSVYKMIDNYVIIQPTRGYGLVNPDIYHSAFIVPCRLYWMSYVFCARVCAGALLINVGKHGSLEWLPGRAITLSRFCYPELIGLGLPNLYFYIVNDPGEGTQAKRRTNSVIIDHFLPPLRALSELPSTAAAERSAAYINFNEKYYCNLLGLQFRNGLYTYGYLEKPSVIISLLCLLDWRLNLSIIDVCKRVEFWDSQWTARARGSLWLLYNLCFVLNVSLTPLLVLKKPMLLVTASCFYEIYSVVKSVSTKFVLPGLSSAFSRADGDILPTGRNFFSKSVLDVPTPWAYSVSVAVVNKLLRAYYNRSCCWLKSIGVSVWATANMRTGGDDIAIILRLIGVKPIWEANSCELIGFEVLPLKQTRFPRVSVLVRASGLFRDTYYQVVDRLYKIFETLACLADVCEFGLTRESLSCKLFSSEAGCYGTGIQELLDSSSWSNISELAKKYIIYGSYCYDGLTWKKDVSALVESLSTTQVVLQSQDNREHDILDSDDYFQFEGGMNAAVRWLRSKVCGYHIDTSFCLKSNIKIRRLKYEIDRVLKCKLLNQSWVMSMLEHGYKGVSEIVASLSYFYSFAATSFQASNSQFMSVFNTLIANPSIKNLIALNNYDALVEIKRRLLETIHRNIWSPVSNCIRFCLET